MEKIVATVGFKTPEFDQDAYIKEVMPESGEVGDFIFGPAARKDGEAFEEYQLRRKIEKRMFKLRQKTGINAWPGRKGTFTDPLKRQRKALRAVSKQNRVGVPRSQRV